MRAVGPAARGLGSAARGPEKGARGVASVARGAAKTPRDAHDRRAKDWNDRARELGQQRGRTTLPVAFAAHEAVSGMEARCSHGMRRDSVVEKAAWLYDTAASPQTETGCIFWGGQDGRRGSFRRVGLGK